jgi:hypothetical protein
MAVLCLRLAVNPVHFDNAPGLIQPTRVANDQRATAIVRVGVTKAFYDDLRPMPAASPDSARLFAESQRHEPEENYFALCLGRGNEAKTKRYAFRCRKVTAVPRTVWDFCH